MRVTFEYHSGLVGERFHNAQLWGSWNAGGMPDDRGSARPMETTVLPDGTQFFRAEVDFPDHLAGQDYRWGVRVDRAWPQPAQGLWAIVHEVGDAHRRDRHRTFTLRHEGQRERYFLSQLRRLGANKTADRSAHFAVWAPHAEEVQLVFGKVVANRQGGYIADDGSGIDGDPIPMARGNDGVWWVDSCTSEALASFAQIDHRPYMFRLRKEGAPEGQWSYRTDLYSRCQIGKGGARPDGAPHRGSWMDLDGSVSCSVVVDPEKVTKRFSEPDWPETQWCSVDEFWADEFAPQQSLPQRIEDLVIYEMHVGGLGIDRRSGDGRPEPGTLEDALALLPYLAELGVNAVELLPMAEFDGWCQWGYATSHYCAVEFSGGGRDQLKHFVKRCHQLGIAVILDVVYNHYSHHSERAQWAYDSDNPERNLYYWYEGQTGDYSTPEGGYVNNVSTGWAPRYWEEMVRSMFSSSALALVTEFHIDGFRVDQTTSIHSYNTLNADGRALGNANMLGAKTLREWTNALRLVSPGTFLMAEDHSGWDAVTRATDRGGLGFDAAWYADHYHHLAGDTDKGSDYAKLLTTAARNRNGPLQMGYFAGALAHTGPTTVVYNESHDEAGNAQLSGRTLVIAVDRAPLVDETRRYAEARARFAAGFTLLSAGVPMFFMGEEVGFQNDYTYDGFVHQKEDFQGLKKGQGRGLFEYYQALIGLRRSPHHPEMRAGRIEILHVNDGGRALAFLRHLNGRRTVVLGSLSDTDYPEYVLIHPALAARRWREVLSSDDSAFGGWSVTNGSEAIDCGADGAMTLAVPRCGLVVLTAE